jgi:hypothetical protein
MLPSHAEWQESVAHLLKQSGEKYSGLLDWLRYFFAFMLYMYGTSKRLHFQFNMYSE